VLGIEAAADAVKPVREEKASFAATHVVARSRRRKNAGSAKSS
jgi:hypothetical protein